MPAPTKSPIDVQRHAAFAEYLLSKPEWDELLTAVKDNIVMQWMHSTTVEQREACFAKLQGCAATHAQVRAWQTAQTMADQTQGDSTPSDTGLTS